jgi:hypothetical protein
MKKKDHAIKFHSKSCEITSKQTADSLVYGKLDPTDPLQAHKIQQRHRTISKGKNTLGYDIYRQQIPKHKRLRRSMETPSTPDHTLNIPNKKWNGLVKAWYVLLDLLLLLLLLLSI